MKRTLQIFSLLLLLVSFSEPLKIKVESDIKIIPEPQQYEPLPDSLENIKPEQILGVQANFWNQVWTGRFSHGYLRWLRSDGAKETIKTGMISVTSLNITINRWNCLISTI